MFTPIIPDGGGYDDPVADPRKALDEQLRKKLISNNAIKGPAEGVLYAPELQGENASYEGYGRATGPAGTVFLKNGTPNRASTAPAAPAGLMGMAQPQGSSMLQDDLLRYHQSRQGGPPDMSGWSPQQREIYNRPMPTAGSAASQDQLLKAQMAMSRDDKMMARDDRLMAHEDKIAQMQADREDKRYAADLSREDAREARTRQYSKEDREIGYDAEDTQAYAAMAASTDPRVRAIGVEGMKKSRAFAKLDPNIVNGLGVSNLVTSTNLIDDLTNYATSFAQKDANWGWSDPGQQELDAVVTHRDKLVNAFVTEGHRKEQAIEAANRVIEKAVLPQAERWGSGWIKSLRQQIGTVPGDAPMPPRGNPRYGTTGF